MKQSKVALIFIFFSFHSFCQDQLGLMTDNYQPVNQRFINPSLIVDPKPWLDINILGVGGYVRNNSVYIPNIYLLNPDTYTDALALNPQESGYGYGTANVLGPSFTLAIKRSSIGFHMSARGYAFIKNLPEVTAQLLEEFHDTRVPDGLYFARNIRAKALTWEEYGISYGQMFYNRNKDIWQGGITVNRLFGANATGLFINTGELSVVNDEGTLNNLEGRYWYNEPARRAGRGFSGNLGLTYKKMKKDISNYVPHSVYGSCVVADYKHRIGISLIDVGAIRFDNLALYSNIDENTKIDTLDNIADASDEALARAEGREFTAWLPSAASLQYDYNLERGFYFNATLTQRVSFPQWFGTERASLYSLGLRYEQKAFTIAIPVSLHEYSELQTGFYLRIWFFSIGTDNISPFLRKQDLFAADVYTYFKWPIFKHPVCRSSTFKEKKNRGVMNKFMCPVW